MALFYILFRLMATFFLIFLFLINQRATKHKLVICLLKFLLFLFNFFIKMTRFYFKVALFISFLIKSFCFVNFLPTIIQVYLAFDTLFDFMWTGYLLFMLYSTIFLSIPMFVWHCYFLKKLYYLNQTVLNLIYKCAIISMFFMLHNMQFSALITTNIVIIDLIFPHLLNK